MSNLNNGGLTRVLNYIKTWVNGLLSSKSDTSHTHTKSQITDFPSIPSKTSDLTNDSGYLTSHQSLSNYVTLNSAQTITATKTISANLAFSTTYTRGTTPSSAVFKDPIDYRDSAGNRICLFESIVATDKSSLNAIYAYNTSVASGGNIGYIGIGSKANGSVFTYAPTPAASDNSTQIATTAWVTSKNYLTSHQSLANYVTSSSLSTALSDKVDRIDHGYKTISGNGTYNWCKLATITIKAGYINHPFSFEIAGRGRARSIVQVLFENTSSNDPSLASFTSDSSTEFYIKKVATSTWELYGHYSEAWGNFTLYRVTISANESSVAVDTTLSNLSSEPSGTTRVSATIPTKTSQLTNDSGFLTSHQSLSNYLAKYTGVSEMGRYIDLHYDNATAARDYDVRLYVDSQTSSNGGGSFKISSASVYTPNNLYLGSYRLYVG